MQPGTAAGASRTSGCASVRSAERESRAAGTAALAAAVLFGASSPLAKVLLGEVSPLLLAGLLYLGSGLGLWAFRIGRDRGATPSGLARSEWGWLAAAIALGGVLAPGLLMFG